MPGKHATLSQVKQVIALREIGATRAVIASETGLSLSTISRVCRRFSASKGRVTSKLVEQSQERLIERMADDKHLQAQIAMLMADDLLTSNMIREQITNGMLQLDMSDPEQVPTNLRALNSGASALATVQKIGRIATGADQENEYAEELPELTIHILTDEDVEQIRAKQRAEDEDEPEPEVAH